MCANRILVQSGIHDEFVEKFAQRVAKLKVGHGLEAGTNVGPLINEAATEKTRALLDDALRLGAEPVAGPPPGAGPGTGSLFFSPTVLVNASASMRVANEELFSPIAPVFKFDTEEEAIQRANDTSAGLASYFFSRDVGRVFRVARQLEYGMVGINTGLISTEVAPFGGIKESGMGREGGRQGIDDYCEWQYLALGSL